jgi:hypothetical protein
MTQAFHLQGTASVIYNEILAHIISIWTIYSKIEIILCKSIKQLINLVIDPNSPFPLGIWVVAYQRISYGVVAALMRWCSLAIIYSYGDIYERKYSTLQNK